MKKQQILLFILALIPLLASAEEIDGINYSLYDNQATVERKSPKYEGNIVIPETITYEGREYRVTSIDEFAFEGCTSLTSINIPNSVTSIRYYAFYSCSGLTSITIPNSVTSIDGWAFCMCSSLTSINIPDGVPTINVSTFSGCSSLTSINIPNSVTSIGNSAFENCSSLTSINIPDGVPTINVSTFSGCSSLTSITIPNSVTSIKNSAFSGCSSLTSINIPDGVPTINVSTFSGCSSLTSITIPNSVTYIGNSAFSGCSALTSITIPYSVTIIASSAFSGCASLPSVFIPNSVTIIGTGAFSGCAGLTSLVVESGNSKYDSRDACNAIIETSTNTLIAGCVNTNIPSSVTYIGNSAFSGCTGLTSITIPNSVTAIGYDAFSGCSSLTSINIPDGVPTINVYTFSGCSSLTSITIPNSVTFIDRSAFVKCTSLTSITIQNPIPPYCEKSAFDDFTIPLYVPQGCVLQYKAADIWRNFIIVREISDEGKDIYLSINDGAHGSLKLKIEPATPYMTLKLEADLGWRVYSVSWNGENVTAEVASDGTYTTPVIAQNSMLKIVYAQGGTSTPAIESNQLQLSSYGNHLIINGTEGNEHVSVYTLDGKCITTLYATADRTEIQLENSGTYIVKVNNSVFKVNL